MDEDNVKRLPSKWSDEAMFRSEGFTKHSDAGGVLPTVRLLWMTPDPLGAVAAMARMYEGKPTLDLEDLFNGERVHYFDEATKTHLRTPLEAVKFHFFIEGVDRAFTHQEVRQRTAAFSQESMRFAVVEDLDQHTTLPPSLAGTQPLELDAMGNNPTGDDGMPLDKNQSMRNLWDVTLDHIEMTYTRLIEMGMPAEDARGLLPHCTATRLNYVTDLLNLSRQAGNRLCTQAQFHWRLVFTLMVNAIRDFAQHPSVQPSDAWQFRHLAHSKLFRPACYEYGKCPFKAGFDRHCSIRDKVSHFAKNGIPSEEWDQDHDLGRSRVDRDPTPWAKQVPGDHFSHDIIPAINPAEWLMNPEAARRRPQ